MLVSMETSDLIVLQAKSQELHSAQVPRLRGLILVFVPFGSLILY